MSNTKPFNLLIVPWRLAVAMDIMFCQVISLVISVNPQEQFPLLNSYAAYTLSHLEQFLSL